MKHFYTAAVACALQSATWAAPAEVADWRESNRRVHEAGGWKAYAREIETDPKQSANAAKAQPQNLLTLTAAIDRALALESALQQSLRTVSRKSEDYLLLSEHQRSAMTREQQVIAEISSLYYNLVFSTERLRYQMQVTETVAIAAEFASRMRKVGNLNALHQAEEQLSLAETEKTLSHARVSVNAAREALIHRLQLVDDGTRFEVPQRLPELPAARPILTETDMRLLATSTSNPAVGRLLSETRHAIVARNEAYDLASHYQREVLPLQRRISEEHLLHYNGMIIGIFDLLKDARKQVHAVEGYLNALHAYWQAESALVPKLFSVREQLAQLRRDAWK